ncbi:MAG TPA: flagellar hook-basal body complex protein FliE [Treponemataceae bacterium]|nr:flagellar hook-basal body complex protein FliE [Treponemataceae bacterium]
MSSINMITNNPLHFGYTGPDAAKKAPMATKGSFDNYLLEAVNSVNDKQVARSNMTEKVITDPNSVNVHDVTIAMAEANLSLSMAQTVIDRLTNAWEKVSSGR